LAIELRRRKSSYLRASGTAEGHIGPVHAGKTLKQGLQRALLKAAGIDLE
jgi:predicted RNA binding protein YcfA (HicA-like mRNA interferase family)